MMKETCSSLTPGNKKTEAMRMAAARLACAVAIAVASASSFADPALAVYRWDVPNGPANLDGFSQWLGTPVAIATAFEAQGSWDDVDGAGWQLGPWSNWVKAGSARELSLAVPLLPATGGSLAECSAGQYDVYWRNLANNLASYGLNSAYLRLGWEMDGSWFRWSAPQGSGREASFAGCFRRVVDAMRQAQPANQWSFVWNPSIDAWNTSAYFDSAWPGDAYVDVVGVDLYDQSWVANTYPYPSTCDDACRLTRQQTAWSAHLSRLSLVRDFAVAHGKPLAFPEWGAIIRSDGHGGGDDPYFVQKMHDFIMNTANVVVFHGYFDVSAMPSSSFDARLTDSIDHDNPTGPTRMPNSAALFKELFATGTTATMDSTPPTIQLTAPAAGTRISKQTTYELGAAASDDVGVIAVDFFVNDQPVCTVQTAPYTCPWRSPSRFMKNIAVKATARDAAGNSGDYLQLYNQTK